MGEFLDFLISTFDIADIDGWLSAAGRADEHDADIPERVGRAQRASAEGQRERSEADAGRVRRVEDPA